jgi:hypothetical protein
MARTDGTDAQLLAGAVALTAVVVPLIGLITIPTDRFEWTASTLAPLFLAAAGFLVMMLIVDPMLSARKPTTRDAVHIWLSKSFMARQPAIELPVLAGLVAAVVEREGSVLLAPSCWPWCGGLASSSSA